MRRSSVEFVPLEPTTTAAARGGWIPAGAAERFTVQVPAGRTLETVAIDPAVAAHVTVSLAETATGFPGTFYAPKGPVADEVDRRGGHVGNHRGPCTFEVWVKNLTLCDLFVTGSALLVDESPVDARFGCVGGYSGGGRLLDPWTSADSRRQADHRQVRRRVRVLLVGEAPTNQGSVALARGTACRARLLELSSLDDDEFDRAFEAVNLLSSPVVDGRWTGEEARLARASARALDLRGRVVVLLGQRVCRAVTGLASATRTFTWHHLRGGVVTRVPHPSRASHLWNRLDVQEDARELLQELARGWSDPRDGLGGSP